jgi:hypothetical protein
VRDATPIALWPGAGLSLAWAGAVGAAATTLDAGIPERLRAARPIAAFVLLVPLAVSAVPALTAMAFERSALENGPDSTLPAFVAAEGSGNPRLGTLVLDTREAGLLTRVVWGGSETLDGQSTERATRSEPTAGDREIAGIAADLVSTGDPAAVGEVASRGIAFVLLTSDGTADASAAGAQRLSAAAFLDQRDDLDRVGDTGRGELWRVTADVQPRADASRDVQDRARLIALAQLAVVAVCLLLAVPTAASRRLARRTPRVVGPRVKEVRE